MILLRLLHRDISFDKIELIEFFGNECDMVTIFRP